MGTDRSGDYHTFNLWITQYFVKISSRFDCRMKLLDIVAAVGVKVAGDYTARTLKLLKVAHPVGTPVTEPHYRNSRQPRVGYLRNCAIMLRSKSSTVT